ncbi:MAG: hypothetical protein WCX77_03340 [Candidatus Paceibacterota bacterium]|jgi:hypothetical protein
MAIDLQEKKSSSPQKILIALLAISAALVLFFFAANTDLFKNMGQAKKEPVSEIKKINIDFNFLSSLALGTSTLDYAQSPSVTRQLEYFPSFPSFFKSSSASSSSSSSSSSPVSSSSSTPVESGRANPFIPYQIGTASEADVTNKK